MDLSHYKIVKYILHNDFSTYQAKTKQDFTTEIVKCCQNPHDGTIMLYLTDFSVLQIFLDKNL